MTRFHMTALLLAGTCFTAVGAHAQTPPPMKEPTTMDRVDQTIGTITGNPMAAQEIDMKRVTDELVAIGAKPIESLDPLEARKNPTIADAAKSVMRKQGMSDAPLAGVTTQDVMYPGAAGELKARIYKPENASGPLPVILYFHGGGWVLADIDTYDSSARALSKGVNAIVVSAHYRLGPENKFPAAHDDAVAAYKWVLAQAAAWGGDPMKVALAGESAGGNLAINVAIAARDQKLQPPVHQLLVYPVAGVDLNTPSYDDNERAMPLNKSTMEWFVKYATNGGSDLQDPRLDLVGKADVKGLPPATIITAEIDPLRSEGRALADKLTAAGVETQVGDYTGVTHEFFGLGDLVAKSKEAQSVSVERLKAAFGLEGRASTRP
jgi:acetyl esterase/lipase